MNIAACCLNTEIAGRIPRLLCVPLLVDGCQAREFNNVCWNAASILGDYTIAVITFYYCLSDEPL